MARLSHAGEDDDNNNSNNNNSSNNSTTRTTTRTTRRRKNNNSKPFASLQPRTQNVSKRTIKSKWSNLPEAAQEKVRAMFRTLERPVIVLQRDERKRVEAQAALAAVIKKYVD